MKNIENTKLKKQEQFLENVKLVLSLFLKDVLKTVIKNKNGPKIPIYGTPAVKLGKNGKTVICLCTTG